MTVRNVHRGGQCNRIRVVCNLLHSYPGYGCVVCRYFSMYSQRKRRPYWLVIAYVYNRFPLFKQSQWLHQTFVSLKLLKLLQHFDRVVLDQMINTRWAYIYLYHCIAWRKIFIFFRLEFHQHPLLCIFAV